jgi:hypothetical protein
MMVILTNRYYFPLTIYESLGDLILSKYKDRINTSIIPPQNVSALPGEEAILSCFVFSTVDHNISWYKVGRNSQLKSNRKFHVLNNGSIIIRYKNFIEFMICFSFNFVSSGIMQILFYLDSNILCCKTSK